MKGGISANTGIYLVFLLSACANGQTGDYSEAAGKRYLVMLDEKMSKLNTESSIASWNYESNITDENLKIQLEVSAKAAKLEKEAWQETIKYPWRTYRDPDTRRQFQKYSFLGAAALSPEKFERLEKLVKDMQGVYGKAKICDYRNTSRCDLHLEPEITEMFASSRDAKELKHLWTEWRKASGRPVRCMFREYVDLINEAARLNNFTDASKSWLRDYESDYFTQEIEQLWQQVRPLYVQLHAYVRRRLREVYGENVVTKTGPLPAHLLGNVWAQTWSNILNETVPYPEKPNTDVTPEMIAQKYTPLKMFKVAEEFFTSLGLSPMPDSFWNNSIIEKPNDGRELICHASAWDFYDGKDFRIKMCTRVNYRQLVVVHHEMGHVQYYLQYNKQPKIFKRGANPGFHEAVGDVMALSVSTPKHLRKIGLLKEFADDEEAEINQLFAMALDKVAFLPFAYLMEQWRWGVFQGKITTDDYNSKWWELREQYQGMQPPTERDEDDFDPGAKYHIVASVPYIRYFVSFVIQFQFHRALCIAAGEFDPANPNLKPLHKCDIYQNKQAGELLGNMLKMGSSKPWPDAMEAITGQREMDAGALLQYFSTLQTWLERENARTGEYIGWEPSSNPFDDIQEYLVADEPEDLFGDNNLGYSYAELVPRNDMPFEAPDYRKPSLRHIYRRSTENQFEANKLINRKYEFKTPGNPLDKLTQISLQQGQQMKFGKKDSREMRSWDRKGDSALLGYASGKGKAGAKVKDKNGAMMDIGREVESEGKEPSTFYKILACLGSSMAKVHQATPPIETSSDSNTLSETDNLLWKAEIMKLQAENMLKSIDLGDSKYPLLKERKDLSNDLNLIDGSMSLLSRRKSSLRDDSQPDCPSENKSRFEKRLGAKSKEPKSVSKKSYVHYHYNIRTPVYYNQVLIQKPNVNAWTDNDPRNKDGNTRNPEPALPYSVVSVRRSPNDDEPSDRWKSIKLVPIVPDRNKALRLGEGDTLAQFKNDLLRNSGTIRLRRRYKPHGYHPPKYTVNRNLNGNYADPLHSRANGRGR